ncbi:Bifunctional protein Aas [Sodalis praecaptivus]
MWIDGPEFTPFSRMGGIFRRRWFPKITLTVLAPTPLPMPEGRRARDRRRAAGERLRTIMMNARMASRPALTLYDGLLQAMRRYGDSKPCMTDMTLKTDSYHVLLKKAWVSAGFCSAWPRRVNMWVCCCRTPPSPPPRLSVRCSAAGCPPC